MIGRRQNTKAYYPHRRDNHGKRNDCSKTLPKKRINCHQDRRDQQQSYDDVHSLQPHGHVSVVHSSEQLVLAVKQIETVEERTGGECQSKGHQRKADHGCCTTANILPCGTFHLLEIKSVARRRTYCDQHYNRNCLQPAYYKFDNRKPEQVKANIVIEN